MESFSPTGTFGYATSFIALNVPVRPNGVASLLQLRDSEIEKVFALSSESPFHSAAIRTRLFEIAKGAARDNSVHQNFFVFLYFLIGGAYGEHSQVYREDLNVC